MIKLFQTNVGSYLALDKDVLPTDNVSELCAVVKSVSGEATENQVLLTSEGVQMEPTKSIGSYSVGTESKPVFVFFRSCLSSVKPPALTSRLHYSSELQRQLELLRQKPSPAHFQRQTPLAKRLGDRAVDLTQHIKVGVEEYCMQYSGWQSAQTNCTNIISAFQKHQELFSKAVESFLLAKPHYEELLEKFPSQVKVLQQLPLPSPQGRAVLATPPSLVPSTSSSLYDWISSHDEQNSLLDLSTECQKALAQVDSEKLQTCLDISKQILASNDFSPSLELQLKQKVSDMKKLVDQAEDLAKIQTGLAQNIQTTSQRALRSGEASTIADLVVSHHKSLQMMAQQNTELEGIVRSVEEAKFSLTGHIHHGLREIAQLQMKMAQSNSQLVLHHERLKLTRRRFEVLKQVVSAPNVLATVIGEVSRRRGFNTALRNKTEEVATLLHQARAEERELRRSFRSSCGQHFITSLFPELQDKLPDITVHLPRALTASQVSQSSELAFLREQLPEDIRPPATPTHSMLLESTTSSHLSQSSVAVQTEEKRSGGGQIMTSLPVQEKGSGVSSKETGSGVSIGTGSGFPVEAGSGSQWESGVQYDMYLSAQSSVFRSTVKEGSVKADTPVNTDILLSAIDESTSGKKLRSLEMSVSVQTEPSLENISVQTESPPVTLVEDSSMQTFTVLAAERSAQTDRTHWETELELTRSQHQVLLQQIHDLLAEKETLNKTCQGLEDKVSTLGEKEQAFSRLKDSLEHLEQQCSDQHQELKETWKSQAIKLAEYDEKLAQSAILQFEASSQSASEQEELQTRCDELNKEIEEMKEDKARQLSRHQQAQSTLNVMRAQLEQAESKIRTAETEVIQKQAIESKLQAAEKKLSSLLQTEEKLKELENEFSKAQENAKTSLLESQARDEENKVKLKRSEEKAFRVEIELNKLQEHTKITEAEMVQKLKETRIQYEQNEALLTETRENSRREVGIMKDRLEQERLSLLAKLKENDDKLKLTEAKLRRCESELEAARQQTTTLETKCSDLDSRLCVEEAKVISEKASIKALEIKLTTVEKELKAKLDKLHEDEVELSTTRPQLQKSQATIKLMQTNLAEAETNLTTEKHAKITELYALQDSLDKAKLELQESEEALQINEKKLLAAQGTVILTEEKLIKSQSNEQETAERLKQAMESERELKELRREMGYSSPSDVAKAAPSKSVASSVVSELSERVSLTSLHTGCVVLFMNDVYGNYLAVTVDEKLYYLNQSCVAGLHDVAAIVPQLGLKRKLLIGRITERVLVEVRKENNRLRVPVGSRLYKVQAEAVPL